MLEKIIYAKRFDETTKRDVLWKTLVTYFFQKYVKKSDIVLDIACGYGEFINNIRCEKKYGLDINPDTKKFLHKNVTFIKSKSWNIPLKEKNLDKVFISNFFEHITRDEISKTIIEIKRVLKVGGNVMILQPNIRFCAKDYWMFFDHITPIDDRALIEIFEIHGFTVTERFERFLPFTTKQRLPQNAFFVKTYLMFPILWRFFGAQSFLYFTLQKKNT